MSFSNTYKQHLNILIPYYRIRNLKKSKDAQWKQVNFYKDALHIPVCSSSVYCSLEKQKACVRDEVYELAVKKVRKTHTGIQKVGCENQYSYGGTVPAYGL